MSLLKVSLISLLVSTAHSIPFPVEAVKRDSAVPYGATILQCTVPGTVALAFDDGPFKYTSQLLDLFAANNVKATFFLNGKNYGSINDYADVVRRMVSDGHQVGSHTFSHANLQNVDDATITSEMTQLESALTSILGYFPQYMRPPYLAYDDRVLRVLGGLGYKVIRASIDTQDYNNQAAIQTSVDIFKQGLGNGGGITLAHDTLQATANTLVAEMIKAVQAQGLRAVTIGTCLGDDPANWYRAART